MALLLGVVSPTVLSRDILDYSLVSPRIGSVTTGRITKQNASRGVNRNYSTGGGKTLNTSIRNAYSGSDVTPTYSLPSGSRIVMSYNGSGSNYVGESTTLALAPQFGNLVRVATNGNWSPDEY
ncbi:hypothetical protein [Streptococcus ruminantium]|uniref:hypothetical protein n=1 Tax=Streptococcus ruminantium TaxID=1917441 RepID=UPI001D1451F2|nr:hypothetical protein [Streptococcus ruminantium]